MRIAVERLHQRLDLIGGEGVVPVEVGQGCWVEEMGTQNHGHNVSVAGKFFSLNATQAHETPGSDEHIDVLAHGQGHSLSRIVQLRI